MHYNIFRYHTWLLARGIRPNFISPIFSEARILMLRNVFRHEPRAAIHVSVQSVVFAFIGNYLHTNAFRTSRSRRDAD